MSVQSYEELPTVNQQCYVVAHKNKENGDLLYYSQFCGRVYTAVVAFNIDDAVKLCNYVKSLKDYGWFDFKGKPRFEDVRLVSVKFSDFREVI